CSSDLLLVPSTCSGGIPASSIAGIVTMPPPPAIASMKPASSAARNSHASSCRASSCIGRGCGGRRARGSRGVYASCGRLASRDVLVRRSPMHPRLLPTALACLIAACLPSAAAAQQRPEVAQAAQALQARVVEWRRDIHQHPELGNRETRTAALVAAHLRSLGLEPRTGIAAT